MDNAIGIILQMIEDSPALAGSTAIVLTADHGGHDNTHGDTSNPLDFTVHAPRSLDCTLVTPGGQPL